MNMVIPGDSFIFIPFCIWMGGWFWLGVLLIVAFWFIDPRWTKQEGWRFLR